MPSVIGYIITWIGAFTAVVSFWVALGCFIIGKIFKNPESISLVSTFLVFIAVGIILIAIGIFIAFFDWSKIGL